jgi:hypothetical protein
VQVIKMNLHVNIRREIYLSARDIYLYLTEIESEFDDLIICFNQNNIITTSDQSLYEALGAVEDRSKINYNKLVKLLEVASIKSYSQLAKKPRKILTEKRVKEIRGEK